MRCRSGRQERLFAVLRGLGTFFERLAIPDPTFASVAGQLEILREFESVDRTGIFTEAAEHAAAQIVGEVGEFLTASLLVARARDHDQIFRASQCAQVAGNAHGFVGVRVDVEAGRATVALRHLRALHRILLGVNLSRILVAERDLQPLEKVDQKDFAEKALHPHDGASITLNSGEWPAGSGQ